jgi:hypothetical protein
MSWSTIIGVVLVLYALYVIYRGRLTSGDDYGNSTVINRAESPVRFWISVIGMLVLAVLLIFNVFHF